MPAAAAHDRYLATRHFGSLDGLRFLCITAVLWHHTPFREEIVQLSILFRRGHVGVDFFFVLSGFLITTLLLREEAAKGRFSLRGFYWRRILRIVPLYFFVISLAAFYAIGIKGYTEQIEILPYYYLFLSNFLSAEHIGFLAPTWSLSVEEQYYLIWPTLLLFLPRRWITPVLLALIAVNVLSAAGFFGLLGIGPIETGHLRFAIEGATYAPILMGSLVAILLQDRVWFARMNRVTGFAGAPWLWFLALLLALAAFPGVLEGWPNLVVHSLMALMLVSLVVREDNAMAPILKFRPIERIGQISYGIYLYHLFAAALVTKLAIMVGWTHWAPVLLGYYAMTIVIAEISFRTLEAWFLGLRHKRIGLVDASLGRIRTSIPDKFSGRDHR
ncbi:acyltransferase family protein [Rhodovulum marinum]|uniref:Peptidoglycan/LPS O-acetylase OafA/YrhL n=1 Tax=Rhodovulum marinum TaxID=320662 RepID=A0A4R2PUJ5_9RHOB|nr:acyltransferase [Rhodovulum marinum]TCP39567.1 peptidoglycan/LPS O-acetylase OafA/YrhL [Rhodovulum marinum]